MIDNKCSNTLFVESAGQCISTWGGQMEIDLLLKKTSGSYDHFLVKYILN